MAGFFATHRGSELLMREQMSFFIRDAQKRTMEMGVALQQINSAATPDISQQCAHLAQMNSQLDGILEQAQRSLQEKP